MRKDIGYKIKFHRTNRNMTQSDLANGIISVSYLSKIENGSAEPSSEVIDLILKRLEVNLDSQDTKKIKQMCDDWFVALFNKDVKLSTNLYKQIEETKEYISDAKLLHLIAIHKIRYFLIQKDTKKAKRAIDTLSKTEESFDKQAAYYWLKFRAYYFFLNATYNKSLDYYLKAEKYVHYSNYLIEEEKYDLHYMIALSASYVRKTYIVFNHGTMALRYYQRKVHLEESARCHLLLGITAVRIRDYEDALENFELAIKIAKTIENNSILATSLQNIGNLYSTLNKSYEAIYFYKQSYKLREENSKKIIPITSLMKEYYRLHDYKNAIHWLQTGMNIIDTLELSLYYYELKVYDQILNGSKPSSFEKLLVHEVLPYLKEKELFVEKIPFLEIMADYFYKRNKYKLSAFYYQKALEINKNHY